MPNQILLKRLLPILLMAQFNAEKKLAYSRKLLLLQHWMTLWFKVHYVRTWHNWIHYGLWFLTLL